MCCQPTECVALFYAVQGISDVTKTSAKKLIALTKVTVKVGS